MIQFLQKTLTFTFLLSTFCYPIHAEGEINSISNQTLNIPPSAAVKPDEEKKCCSSWFVKERWFLTIDFGVHFKPFLPVEAKLIETKDNKNIFIDKIKGKPFWGESGYLGSYGIAYKRVFENKKWFWGSRIVWTWYYPDVRYSGKNAILTLAGVPFIGKYFELALEGAPTWIEMLMVPMPYFDFGYITDTNISFSIGTFYLWGLSPTVAFPVSDKFSMEIRQVVFLDKLFSGGKTGIHAYMMSIGLNYCLKD